MQFRKLQRGPQQLWKGAHGRHSVPSRTIAPSSTIILGVFGATALVLAGAALTGRIACAIGWDDTERRTGIVGVDALGAPVHATAYFRETRPAIEARLGPPVARDSRRRRLWLAYQAHAGVVEVRYTELQVADRVMVIADRADTDTEMMPRSRSLQP